MLKRLARKILKDDFTALDAIVESQESDSSRLSNVINQLSKENDALRKNRPYRNYSFAPESLTSDDQQTIGEFTDTPIFDLFSKWFKAKADQNNDLLLHTDKASDEQKALWRLAVLMYDDWNVFSKHCKQIAESKLKKESPVE